MTQVTHRATAYFFARTAGVYSSVPADHVAPEGIMAIIFSAFMGAAAGLIAGLVLLPVIRYTAYLAGRSISGAPVVLLGILAGAVLFVCMALAGEEN